MKICELPRGLRELAQKRKDEQPRWAGEENSLTDAFDWRATKEGSTFWASISLGRFDRYYGCRFVNIREKFK